MTKSRFGQQVACTASSVEPKNVDWVIALSFRLGSLRIVFVCMPPQYQFLNLSKFSRVKLNSNVYLLLKKKNFKNVNSK